MTDSSPCTRCLYVPGRGQRNDEGMGTILSAMGWDVQGPDIDLQLCSQPFNTQVMVVYEWLRWALRHQGPLIAKSYGAYLLMHAWTMFQLEDPGEMFVYDNAAHLFTPVTGSPPVHMTAKGVSASRLPRNGMLGKLVSAGQTPRPAHTFMHMGDRDPLMGPAQEIESLDRTNYTLIAIADTGHKLGQEYEAAALMKYVGTPADSQPWREPLTQCNHGCNKGER